jgi:hypothetical protein
VLIARGSLHNECQNGKSIGRYVVEVLALTLTMRE